MIIECCSQERSYTQFYGLIAERFCKLNRIWTESFQEAFGTYYETIHRYETNKLRNIARLFGHLVASDAISWAVLHVVHMNEEETTSSSRIFVKILMQEVMEEVGLKKMAARLKEPELQQALTGIFPTDNPKNTRFAINYFTSIGLGLITEDMRTWLQVSRSGVQGNSSSQKLTCDPSDRTLPRSSWPSDKLLSKPNRPTATVRATAATRLPTLPATQTRTPILLLPLPDPDLHLVDVVRLLPDEEVGIAACPARLLVEDGTRIPGLHLPSGLIGMDVPLLLLPVDGMRIAGALRLEGDTTTMIGTDDPGIMAMGDDDTIADRLLLDGGMTIRLLRGEGLLRGMSGSSGKMRMIDGVGMAIEGDELSRRIET